MMLKLYVAREVSSKQQLQWLWLWQPVRATCNCSTQHVANSQQSSYMVFMFVFSFLLFFGSKFADKATAAHAAHH